LWRCPNNNADRSVGAVHAKAGAGNTRDSASALPVARDGRSLGLRGCDGRLAAGLTGLVGAGVTLARTALLAVGLGLELVFLLALLGKLLLPLFVSVIGCSHRPFRFLSSMAPM